MTTAIFRSSALTVPQTQNTAPVLEFNCLYTHDLRRKQKRWQDGFLRFHTFNKRVMLYDVPRNFVGDMHWKESSLQEGDEMTLEKSGVLVQVAEEVGRTETDLTELRKSAKKPRKPEHTSPPGRSIVSTGAIATKSNAGRPPPQMKRRSLNALLGTPKGPIGKSVMPSRSPYDDRHAGSEIHAWNDGRPPKRRKVDMSGLDIAHTGHAATNSAWNENKLPQTPVRRIPEVIDLRDDDDEAHVDKFLPPFSSDALQPLSSPLRHIQASARKRTPRRSTSPGIQSQGLPNIRETHRLSHSEVDPRCVPSEEGPTRPRTSKRDIASQTVIQSYEAEVNMSVAHVAERSQEEVAQRKVHDAASKTSNTGARLRLAAPVSKRKILLCQSDVSIKPTRIPSLPRDLRRNSSPELTSEDEVSLQVRRQRRNLEERMARIERKRSKVSSERNMRDTEEAENDSNYDENVQMAVRSARRETACQLSTAKPVTSEKTVSSITEQPSRLESIDGTRRNKDQVEQGTEVPRTVQSMPANEASSRKSHPLAAVSVPTRPQDWRPTRKAGASVGLNPASSTTRTSNAHESCQEGNESTLDLKEVPTGIAQGVAKAASKSKAEQTCETAGIVDTTTAGCSTNMLSRPSQPSSAPDNMIEAPPPCPPNAWSREAFDLFQWRPPNWDEGTWCVRESKDRQEGPRKIRES